LWAPERLCATWQESVTRQSMNYYAMGHEPPKPQRTRRRTKRHFFRVFVAGRGAEDVAREVPHT
jgi:hypothetical protein